MSTRKCIHLVTGNYFQSRNKDGVVPFDWLQVKIQYCTYTSPLRVVNTELLVIENLTCVEADKRSHPLREHPL